MAPPIQSINPTIRFFEPGAVQQPVPYTFAIMVCRYQDQWIWVKHKERDTWELPAGHIESRETPLEAAHRELFEETGALEFTIEPVISYEGVLNERLVFGLIFFVEITRLGPLPDFEIGETGFFEGIPERLTYPLIQPHFFGFVQKKMYEKGFIGLTALQNIGITLAEDLADAGIMNPKELLELGTEKSFQRIQSINKNVCISELYAIEGAIQGIRWHTIDPMRKEELRNFYNQLNPSSL